METRVLTLSWEEQVHELQSLCWTQCLLWDMRASVDETSLFFALLIHGPFHSISSLCLALTLPWLQVTLSHSFMASV